MLPGPKNVLEQRFRSPAALAGIGQLPAHQHHQAKTEEEENQPADAVLNPDHLVIGRENVFSPETEFVMLVPVMGVVFVENGGLLQKWRRPFRRKD